MKRPVTVLGAVLGAMVVIAYLDRLQRQQEAILGALRELQRPRPRPPARHGSLIWIPKGGM